MHCGHDRLVETAGPSPTVDLAVQSVRRENQQHAGLLFLKRRLFVFVNPNGTKSSRDLRSWLTQTLEFNPRAVSSRGRTSRIKKSGRPTPTMRKFRSNSKHAT